jgi:hypothetical protein
MNKSIFSWLKESHVFYIILLINLIILSTIKYYPSMDGPEHLYNSNIIYHLLKGDCRTLYDYYILNNFSSPNWTDHFILSILLFIWPAWMAEKILLFFYLIGLTISFRLLIKQLCPTNNYLSFIIFPFAYSYLFHLGFYNFSLSFIFLFYTLYYWFKHKDLLSLGNYTILFVLITLTYFSNIVTYCFLGLCLGLFLIVYEISAFSENKDLTLLVKKLSKRLILLFTISIPSLILFAIFYKTTKFPPSQNQYSANELMKWLNDVRCLIVYDYKGEEIITGQFLHILIAIVAVSIFLRYKNKSSNIHHSAIKKNDIILVPVVICLVLLFITPDGSHAGMMSDRYCLMFFMLCIVWVCSMPIPKRVGQIIMVLIIILHFSLLLKHFNGSIKNLNKDAVQISETSVYLEPGSVVLPVDLTDNWLESHFSNYLGVSKPIIILDNYEANVGWFPVKWNLEKTPRILLNDKTLGHLKRWFGIKNTRIKQIDYVFLYGNISKIDDTENQKLKNELLAGYNLVYTSNNKYIGLYRKKENFKINR